MNYKNFPYLPKKLDELIKMNTNHHDYKKVHSCTLVLQLCTPGFVCCLGRLFVASWEELCWADAAFVLASGCLAWPLTS